jgi:DnaJ like chaperone protein
VAVFRKIFVIPPEDEASAARIFNLARGDVAGFDAYARKIASLFNRDGQSLCADDHSLLIDILEGLFQISLADGAYHPREDAFLAQVAQIFGLDARCFGMVRARFVAGAPRDPYDVLGVDHSADLGAIKFAWRAAVKDCHPDVMVARGVPPEAVQMAANRLIIINNAWSEVQSLRAGS